MEFIQRQSERLVWCNSTTCGNAWCGEKPLHFACLMANKSIDRTDLQCGRTRLTHVERADSFPKWNNVIRPQRIIQTKKSNLCYDSCVWNVAKRPASHPHWLLTCRSSRWITCCCVIDCTALFFPPTNSSFGWLKSIYLTVLCMTVLIANNVLAETLGAEKKIASQGKLRWQSGIQHGTITR